MINKQSWNSPSSQFALQQVRCVGEAWIEACLTSNQYVDETPYLIQPIQEEEDDEGMYQPSSANRVIN